jgi:hypothetical protein
MSVVLLDVRSCSDFACAPRADSFTVEQAQIVGDELRRGKAKEWVGEDLFWSVCEETQP